MIGHYAQIAAAARDEGVQLAGVDARGGRGGEYEIGAVEEHLRDAERARGELLALARAILQRSALRHLAHEIRDLLPGNRQHLASELEPARRAAHDNRSARLRVLGQERLEMRRIAR